MRTRIGTILIAVVALAVGAAELPTRGIQYVTEGDAYRIERCKLDLRIPSETGFPTVVWFHGGGLTA